MNWVADTVGGCLLDYYRDPGTLQTADGIFQAAMQADAVFHKLRHTDDRFVLPPPTNPFNFTGGILSVAHGKSSWVDYFLNASAIPARCDKEDMFFPAIANWPFVRPRGVIALSWTYDEDLVMKPNPVGHVF
eukprot:UN3487